MREAQVHDQVGALLLAAHTNANDLQLLLVAVHNTCLLYTSGMIAGGPVRAVIEAAGIKDVRAKSMRSNNPINVVSATFAGLCGLVSACLLYTSRCV